MKNYFDENCINYDRLRPDYPDALFNYGLSQCGRAPETALEVGCGTGTVSYTHLDVYKRQEEHHPGLALCEVTPKHIQDYYTYELTVRGVSANTVIHRHANIRKALQHAFKLGLIDTNPADRIERPKKEKFVGSVYEEDELNRLFEIVKGDPIELGVILGAFYGLRRSEAVGLKWDAIDFKKKTIAIRHTVTQATRCV